MALLIYFLYAFIQAIVTTRSSHDSGDREKTFWTSLILAPIVTLVWVTFGMMVLVDFLLGVYDG